jgi:hypothetical protein
MKGLRKCGYRYTMGFYSVIRNHMMTCGKKMDAIGGLYSK